MNKINPHMKYYNELFYYIMGINKRFKEYTNVRGCHIWE